MRKAFSIIVVALLTLALLALLSLWQVNRSLQAMGIEQVDYRLQGLGWHHLRFAHLSLVYNAENSRTLISLSDARIGWQWPSGWLPQLSAVDIGQLQLTYSPQDDESAADKAPGLFALPDNWSIPDALPEHLEVKNFLANVPCPAGECSLAGSLGVKKSQQVLQLNLTATPAKVYDPEHQLQLTADYRVRENIPHLAASLAIDQNLELQLQTYLTQEQEIYWSGSLQGHIQRGHIQSGPAQPEPTQPEQTGYPDPWWRAALSEWNVQLSPEWDDALQQPVALKSEWKLAVTPLLNLVNGKSVGLWKQAFTGTLALDASVPVPIGLRGVGEFSGRATIDLAAVAGQIERYQLLANIEASNLVIPESLQAKGLLIDAAQVTINSAVKEKVDLARIPVTIDASIQGSVEGKSSAHLLVDIFDKKVIAENVGLSITAKEIVPISDFTIRNLALDAHASGIWQHDKFEIKIAESSHLSADVDIPGLSVKARSAQWTSSQLTLAGTVEQGQIQWQGIEFNSKFSVAIKELSHPQLKPNSWLWQADIQGQLEQFNINGELAMANAFSVKHQLERKPSGLVMEWQVADIFLLAGNPVADTIAAWPPLLTFTQGKIKASGDLLLDLEKNRLEKSQTSILLSDLNGIYDTLVFQGITTKLNIRTDPGTLKIATDEIKINQLSKGFSVGPLVAGAIYQADLENPAGGKLDLRYFHGDVMGGTISTPAQVFNFSEDKQRVLLELKNIDLATLLKQHPSTEISGNGRLSGKVPIDISSKGISVVKGVVSAEPPGGQLQYHSERAAAIAQSQPSMKLITEALDDFHYSVLASKVNYDESGKLMLSVTLQGKNPALENGRLINFNINLEEDLPAMITSIQLANNISDIVKRRLQERLQKKGDSKAGK